MRAGGHHEHRSHTHRHDPRRAGPTLRSKLARTLRLDMNTRTVSPPEAPTPHRARPGWTVKRTAVAVVLLAVAAGGFWAGRATSPSQIGPPFSGTIGAVQHNPDVACVVVSRNDIRCGVPFALPGVSVTDGTKVLVRPLPILAPDQPASFLLFPGK